MRVSPGTPGEGRTPGEPTFFVETPPPTMAFEGSQVSQSAILFTPSFTRRPQGNEEGSDYKGISSVTMFLHYFKVSMQLSVWSIIFFFAGAAIPLNPISKTELKPNINYLAMIFILTIWAPMPRTTALFFIVGEPKKFQTTGWAKHILPVMKYWCVIPVPLVTVLVNCIPFAFNHFPVPFLMVSVGVALAFFLSTPLALLNYPSEIRKDPLLRARISMGIRLYTPATTIIFAALLFFWLYFVTPDTAGSFLRALVIGLFHAVGFAVRYVIYKISQNPNSPKAMDLVARFYVTTLMYLSTTFVLPSGKSYYIYIAYVVLKGLSQVVPCIICTKWFSDLFARIVPKLKYEATPAIVRSEAINLFTNEFAVIVSVMMFIPFSMLYYFGYNHKYTFYYSFDRFALVVTLIYVVCDMLFSTGVFVLCRRYFMRDHNVDPLAIGLHYLDAQFWMFVAVTMVGMIFLFSVILRHTEVVYVFLPHLYG